MRRRLSRALLALARPHARRRACTAMCVRGDAYSFENRVWFRTLPTGLRGDQSANQTELW